MSQHLSKQSIGESLRLFYTYLNSNIAVRESQGVRHAGFVLDITNPSLSGRMGVGATSLGLAVYSVVVNNKDTHIWEMENLLLSKRCQNGSWTISALVQHSVSLVYTTCYVLESLARSDQVRNEVFLEEGLNWLLEIQNKDGGWGLTECSESHVHSTAEVLYFMSLYAGRIHQNAFLSAKKCLLDQREDGTYWLDSGGQPSLFLTSLAYRAIASNGNYRFELDSTRKWLVRNLTTAPCEKIVTYYVPIGEDEHIIESFDSHPRATIFEALATGISSDFEPSIEREAARILKQQNILGFWQCDKLSQMVPTFLNYRICIGLANYLRYLDDRPRNVWWYEVRRFFEMSPGFSTTILLLAGIGIVSILSNLVTLVAVTNAQIPLVNEYFKDYSGIANLFQITGISLAAIVALIVTITRRILRK